MYSNKEKTQTNFSSTSERTNAVNVRPLKAFASTRLPRDCPLRQVLVAERDTLNANEFLAKMETWLKLLRLRRG